VPLHVHEYGDPAAAPVVCLHGVTGHGERFRALGEGPLAARRVLAPDLRGHGRSPSEPPWGTEAHAGDVASLARGLGLERFDLVGFSFGARVAAVVAARAPERVGRVCLLDPAIRLAPQVCLEMAEDERPGEAFASAEEAIEARLAAGTLFHTPREMLEEEMRQHLVRGEDGRFAYRYVVSAAVVAWSEMAAPAPPVAEVPTLIVQADRSWLPTSDQVARYSAALGSRLAVETVPGGHAVLWDALAETGRVLSAFLAD
jgi:lipase